MTRRTTNLTPSEIRRIRAARREGKPTDEIAKEFNCSRSTVWNYAPMRSRAKPERSVDGSRFAMLLSVESAAVAPLLQTPGVKLLDLNPE